MNTPASHETNKNINPALPSTNRAATNGLPTAGFKPANSSGRLIGAVIRHVRQKAGMAALVDNDVGGASHIESGHGQPDSLRCGHFPRLDESGAKCKGAR